MWGIQTGLEEWGASNERDFKPAVESHFPKTLRGSNE